VVAICRETGTVGDTRLLVALDNLAILYQLQGKTAAAASVLNEGLALNITLHGEHHPGVIQSLYRLAELDLKSANYGEAKHHLGHAVRLLDASSSPIADHDGAALLHNIGELYRVSGHYAEAESAYIKAMTLWKRSPATNQREIAITQTGMDRLHAIRGNVSSHVGLESESHMKDAPPASSLLIESARAQM
jgi:tetratricopeptide (TPR) repeat protein